MTRKYNKKSRIQQEVEKKEVKPEVKEGTPIEAEQKPDPASETENQTTEEEAMATLPQKDLFRVDEVATYFQVTDPTVRNWLDHGHLEKTKIVGVIRITRESILKCALGYRVKKQRESEESIA